ncbi:hybrid sensor histidine kinase/response regulator [Chitinivibrio alkaliphilus]|uniref:histidine kinase n=1 Tax=Chitinivibrio alkaliphilus ACht1 TaxID=1313304 RepID=U7DE14_9BACT|nr:ATP-binding protein [Chitinivibrio alkaliphilus]ERP39156.1 two-component system sensor protein [Chitinivibrio alkaliphilus ACht1]
MHTHEAHTSDDSTAQLAFLSNIGHELRTPMNSILGFIQLVLRDERLSSDLGGYLEQAQDSADKLLHMIDTLLDLSKLQARVVTLENRPLDINYIIETVRNSYEGYGGDEVVLQVIKNNYDRFFLGDAVRIEQIVSEIVGNAFKFTPKGAITVYLESRDHPEKKGWSYLTINVNDTGIGVREKDMALIFKPFSQVDNSSTRRFGGIGSGLSIVSELLSLMDGSIRFSSEYEEGSAVSIQIPLEKSDASQIEQHESEVLSAIHAESSRSYKILVVDDVSLNLELARANLEKFGHTILLAQSGIEAIELYENHVPELIFMDLHMPLMNGAETVRYLHDIAEDKRTSPFIIAMTASIIKEEYADLTNQGFDYVISKPLDYPKLVRKLETILPGELSGLSQEKLHDRSHAESKVSEYLHHDRRTLERLIQKQFESYNPDEILPYLSALAQKMPECNFSLVKKALRVYNFDEAYELYRQEIGKK